MDQEEAIRLLTSGSAGVEEWNGRMEDGEAPPSLYRADLRQADLANARLVRVELSKAQLDGANLSGANLNLAHLRRTSLTGTNLSKSRLLATVMAETRVDSASFREALFGGTVIACDLSAAIDLNTTLHRGPSHISLGSLFCLSGNLPEAFLRGCGVSDRDLRYFRSDAGSAETFFSCFISYSHKDRDFALRMESSLQDRGIRCWRDEKDIRPGDDIYESIEEAISKHDKVLLCASRESLTSWWVDNDIDAAFDRERQMMGHSGERRTVLIPLNLDGFVLSGDYKSGKKRLLQARLAADFTDWQSDDAKFQGGVERVIAALRVDAGEALSS